MREWILLLFCMIQVIKDSWNWSWLLKTILFFYDFSCVLCVCSFCTYISNLRILLILLEFMVTYMSVLRQIALNFLFPVWSLVCSTSTSHFSSWQTPGTSVLYYSFFNWGKLSLAAERTLWKQGDFTGHYMTKWLLKDRGVACFGVHSVPGTLLSGVNVNVRLKNRQELCGDRGQQWRKEKFCYSHRYYWLIF